MARLLGQRRRDGHLELGRAVADEVVGLSDLPQPIGPEEHKAAARQLGLGSLENLLVLSRTNDPFQRGTPAHHRDARWFADLWERFGYSSGAHLRRVHYQAMSVQAPKPDGTPYANTDQDWAMLLEAGKSARLLGLVDPEAFADQRNNPPRLGVSPRYDDPEPDWEWSVPGEEYPRSDATDLRWSVPSLSYNALDFQANYRLPRPQAVGYDYNEADQPVLVEVWIEKSTMNDVLVPVCAQLAVNLLAGTGFQSITAAVALLRRAERHGKPAHVLYISDFDPAGVMMPVAIARQAQFMAARLGIDAELTLHPLALTTEQVATHQLPRVPVKLDKNGRPDKRGKHFEERNGQGVVELDALEALHPGALADLVRQAVHPYADPTLPHRLHQANRDASADLATTWDTETADLVAERDQLEADIRQVVGSYRQRLRDLARELGAELQPHQQRLDDLRGRVVELVDGFEVELPGRPEAEVPDVDRDVLLYDSTRGWWEQLQTFKAHMAGSENGATP
jgi:hypothetical protein